MHTFILPNYHDFNTKRKCDWCGKRTSGLVYNHYIRGFGVRNITLPYCSKKCFSESPESNKLDSYISAVQFFLENGGEAKERKVVAKEETKRKKEEYKRYEKEKSEHKKNWIWFLLILAPVFWILKGVARWIDDLFGWDGRMGIFSWVVIIVTILSIVIFWWLRDATKPQKPD